MAAAATLSIDDYRLSYRTGAGTLRVLDGIDLDIHQGEVLGLVGESGSGKSTLAYAVMRALRAPVATQSGIISLGATALTALMENEIATLRGNRIAMVFQDPGASLNPTMTLGEHFAQVLRRHRQLDGSGIRTEIRRLIEMVGLPDPDLMMAKYPHEASGGEKQRAVIALAFACDPELILFDEPTSALDATTAANILELFRDLQARTRVSALFISHDLGTVGEIAHRIAVIYAGRIVEVAGRDALFREPRHPYTRALLASLPRPTVVDHDHALLSIPGSLPDRLSAAKGCNFAPRCEFAAPICQTEPPVLDDDRDHPAACFRWREVLTQPLGDVDKASEYRKDSDRDAVLEVRGLAVHIRRRDLFARLLGREPATVYAVDDVDFQISRGETLGLVGESGCGKSTLARALAGLLPFDGEIDLMGQRVTTSEAIDRAYRQCLQIIFQNPDLSLNPRQRVATILSRPLRLYRRLDDGELKREVVLQLERVKLPAEYATRYPHELSGGEKQRVAIARALAADPTVIVCDEITSGLDASVQASIVNLLRDIQAEQGLAYLFITHELNLLRHIADRVAVMYLGRIVEMRAAASLGAPPYHPYTEALLSAAPVLDERFETRRVALAGELPTRTSRLRGCVFESRCPRRVGDVCGDLAPPTQEVQLGHWFACHIGRGDLESVPPIWRQHGSDG